MLLSTGTCACTQVTQELENQYEHRLAVELDRYDKLSEELEASQQRYCSIHDSHTMAKCSAALAYAYARMQSCLYISKVVCVAQVLRAML
jgi:hypothetical protein